MQEQGGVAGILEGGKDYAESNWGTDHWLVMAGFGSGHIGSVFMAYIIE